MSALLAAFTANLRRYRRSRGIWLLMLVAPIAARFWVAREDGSAMAIAIDGRLPTPSSEVIGLALGAVCVTGFLPVAWAYLRVNANRRQPWQVCDVTPASSVDVALGRFAADAMIMIGLLAALTLAGCILALLTLDTVEPFSLIASLWLIALPPLLCVAGAHRLFDGLPLLRRAPGDLLFFVVWMTMLVTPFAGGASGPGLAAALHDVAGIVRPMTGGRVDQPGFAIGIMEVRAGYVPVDVDAGLRSDGYILSRLIWAAVGLGFTLIAGMIYTSPRAVSAGRRTNRLFRGSKIGIVPDPIAVRTESPLLILVLTEIGAILVGPRVRWLAFGSAILGIFGDYRHLGSPVTLVILAFGLSAHAGRWMSKGLAPLSTTLPMSLVSRIAMTVAAAAICGSVLALPASLARFDTAPIVLGVLTGSVTGFIAIVLAALTRSGNVPRLVLLVVWYAYFSA